MVGDTDDIRRDSIIDRLSNINLNFIAGFDSKVDRSSWFSERLCIERGIYDYETAADFGLNEEGTPIPQGRRVHVYFPMLLGLLKWNEDFLADTTVDDYKDEVRQDLKLAGLETVYFHEVPDYGTHVFMDAREVYEAGILGELEFAGLGISRTALIADDQEHDNTPEP